MRHEIRLQILKSSIVSLLVFLLNLDNMLKRFERGSSQAFVMQSSSSIARFSLVQNRIFTSPYMPRFTQNLKPKRVIGFGSLKTGAKGRLYASVEQT